MTLPSYQDVNEILSGSHLLITPSELHGMLCGYICAGINQLNLKDDNIAHTLLLATPDGEDNTEINHILNALFTSTQIQIQEFELSFRLLLPDEEAPLTARAIEFAKWCEGFIISIKSCTKAKFYRDQDEVDDILKKLQQITALQFHDLEYTEEDEFFFMEVLEFVRLSVFVIYQELPESDAGVDKPSIGTPTLH